MHPRGRGGLPPGLEEAAFLQREDQQQHKHAGRTATRYPLASPTGQATGQGPARAPRLPLPILLARAIVAPQG